MSAKNIYVKKYMFLILVIFLWSGVAVAFKLSLENLNIENLLLYSSSISTIALLFIIITTKSVNLLFRQNPMQLLLSALTGLLNPFIICLILF